MAKFAKGPRRAFKRITQAGRQALIAHTPPWAKRVFGPAALYFDMLVFDHGIFRLIYVNRHRIDGRAWRSAQPAPHQIGRLAHEGIKTVVNLRGSHPSGSYWLEEEACRRHGIKLVDFQVRSRAAPSLEELRGAKRLFETIEYPMLMHCKSGADRAGLMSVLYAHLVQGQPIEVAKQQLSLRYGHIRQADTGILDHFFDAYIEHNRRHPMPFFEWVETVYDPEAVKATFTASGFANRIVNSVLRRE